MFTGNAGAKRMRGQFMSNLEVRTEKQAAWQAPWEHQLSDALGPAECQQVARFLRFLAL